MPRYKPLWPLIAPLMLGSSCVLLTEPRWDLSNCAAPARSSPSRAGLVRVVMFGDSNIDGGWNVSGALVENSYVSGSPLRIAPDAPNGSRQLAGKLEALSDSRDVTYRAVNHGEAGTGTGTGRHSWGTPNARMEWKGVTRFEAEVLGVAAPSWDGGDGILRVQAFVPGADDYAFVAMGTNDATAYGLTAPETLANLTWMAERWIQAGLAPSHLLIGTLPPRLTENGSQIPAINVGVRALARERGLTLIDPSACVSADDGVTWRATNLHVGDGVHYSEEVREWLAMQIAGAVHATR